VAPTALSSLSRSQEWERAGGEGVDKNQTLASIHNETTYTYDPQNRLLTQTHPDGATTTYTYDTKGNRITETNANGTTTHYLYDNNGNLTQKITDPNGLALTTLYHYNSQNNIIKTQQGKIENNELKIEKTTEHHYDALGRRTTTIEDPDNLAITTSYTYDNNDNPLQKTDPNGNTATFLYNANNQLTYTIDPQGYVTKTEYDPNNNPTKTIHYTEKLTLPSNVTTNYIQNLLNNGKLTAQPQASTITVTEPPNQPYQIQTGQTNNQKTQQTTQTQLTLQGNILTILPHQHQPTQENQTTFQYRQINSTAPYQTLPTQLTETNDYQINLQGIPDNTYEIQLQTKTQNGHILQTTQGQITYTAPQPQQTQMTASAETQANTKTSSYQRYPAITSLTNGDYMIVWESTGDGSNRGVYGQRFNQQGQKLGTETLINTYTKNYQDTPKIASLTNAQGEKDRYIVAWESVQDGSSNGIYYQIFDQQGNKTGPETRANNKTSGDQKSPAVTGLTNGNFVIAWRDSDGSGKGIYARTFDINGNPLNDDSRINTTTSSDQEEFEITALKDGGYIIVWQHKDDYVKAQRYDATNQKIGQETQINQNTSGSRKLPDVAALENGGYIISWETTNLDGNGYAVAAKIFDNQGQEQGNEFQINTYTTSYQDTVQLIGLTDGNIIAVWESYYQDGNDNGVYGQKLTPTGEKTGQEFQINSHENSHQNRPVVTALQNGGYAIAWESKYQDGNDYGIYTRSYTTPQPPPQTPQTITATTTTQTYQNTETGQSLQNYLTPEQAQQLTHLTTTITNTQTNEQTSSQIPTYISPQNITTHLNITDTELQNGQYQLEITKHHTDGTTTTETQTYETGPQQNTYSTTTFTIENIIIPNNTTLTAEITNPTTNETTTPLNITQTTNTATLELQTLEPNTTYTAQLTLIDQTTNSPIQTLTGTANQTQGLTLENPQLTTFLENAQTTQTLYDTNNRPTYKIDPEGYITRYTYDPNNNLTQTIQYPKINLPQPFTIATLNAALTNTQATAHLNHTISNHQQHTERQTTTTETPTTLTINTFLQTATLEIPKDTQQTEAPQQLTFTYQTEPTGLWQTKTINTTTNTHQIHFNLQELQQSDINYQITIRTQHGHILKELTGTLQKDTINTTQIQTEQETYLNSNNTLNPSNAQITFNQNGTPIISWQGLNTTYIQPLAQNGTIEQPLLRIQHEKAQEIVPLANGEYLALWIEEQNDHDTLMEQTLNAQGKITSPEQQITSTYTSWDDNKLSIEQIKRLSDGNIVISYQDDQDDLYIQKITPQGQALNQPTRVGTDFEDSDDIHTITETKNGEFNVTWHRDESSKIHTRLFDAEGKPKGNELNLTEFGNSDDIKTPLITELNNGNLLLIWQGDYDNKNSDEIYAKQITPTGTIIKDTYQINTYTSSTQKQPAIAKLPNGEIFIVWASYGQDGSSYGIYGQKLDANGEKQGEEQQINQTTLGSQTAPTIEANNNTLAIAWKTDLPEGGKTIATQIIQGQTQNLTPAQTTAYTYNQTQQPGISLPNAITEQQAQTIDYITTTIKKHSRKPNKQHPPPRPHIYLHQPSNPKRRHLHRPHQLRNRTSNNRPLHNRNHHPLLRWHHRTTTSNPAHRN